MDIPFWKMHGAGNDFILVDDRGLTFPAADRAWLRRLCARRDGVGAEGVILLQPSTRAHVRMRFFNPDGSDAALCGNGARCVARLAHDLGAAPAALRLETDAGEVAARVSGDTVRLDLPDPSGIRLGVPLDVPGAGRLAVDLVCVGVPHAVVWVTDPDALDIAALGGAIRHHPALAPEGANADFAAAAPDGTVRVRTYERGVEAETLACGTGMAACAVAAALGGRAAPPVRLRCRHGETLTVDMKAEQGRVRDLTLEGPAVHVFRGVLEYPSA
jgi:diaminopimelate epimerase